MGETQTLDGGSIYIYDCYNVNIDANKFVGQKSLIKGGALYIKQD